MSNKTLKIGWLYPELMNIYGDRGNIICLSKRAKWRGIKAEIKELNPGFSDQDLKQCDLLIMGGAQDKQQLIVNSDLRLHHKTLSEMIDNGVPGLYVCGGFQSLGNYYKEADGTIIDGLGIFDLYTQNPGPDNSRLIGNIIIDISDSIKSNSNESANHKSSIISHKSLVVGFENHGGRTYLGENLKPFGKVIKGHGNNGDGYEGAKYKNSFGTYLHGPILPKNPEFADYLLRLALKLDNLIPLDDGLENQAHSLVIDKLGV